MRFFRDPVDADVKRKEITWVAILCLFSLAAWQFVATFLGGAADFTPRSYEEKVLFGGLGAVLLCSVLYIATREREQRQINQRLLTDLRVAMGRLNERVHQLHELSSASSELVGMLDTDAICRLTVESLAKQLQAQCALAFQQRSGWVEFYTTDDELTVAKRELAKPNAELRLTAHELSAPLQINENSRGILAVWRSAEAPGFSSEDMCLLATSANLAAKALENASLHQELKEGYLSTLQTLVQLLGARDNYTACHAQRVSSLVGQLAEYLALPEESLQLLEQFAPLHDLGKVGIPDEILLKVGKLAPAERRICEQHPQTGEQILRPMRPDPRALEMVRHHHERWDGRGYPDGLAGEQIPFLARMLHIVDSFDAILSERPYSPSASATEALAQIYQGSGIEFDPMLVEAFSAMLQEDAAAADDTAPLTSPTKQLRMGALNS